MELRISLREAARVLIYLHQRANYDSEPPHVPGYLLSGIFDGQHLACRTVARQGGDSMEWTKRLTTDIAYMLDAKDEREE